MKTFELKGTVRTDLGKKATKAVRANGSIPCELYGVGENIHFSSTMADLRKLIYTPEIFVVALNIDGKEVKAVMREIQFHPVSDQVLHIDFYQVTEDKPVVMEVPVKLENFALKLFTTTSQKSLLSTLSLSNLVKLSKYVLSNSKTSKSLTLLTQ